LAALGFGLKALHLLGTCSVISATTSVLFALVIFQIESCSLAQTSLELWSMYTFCIAGITGTHYHTKLICWDVVWIFIFFAQAGLQLKSSCSLPLKYLGLQAWATILSLKILNKMYEKDSYLTTEFLVTWILCDKNLLYVSEQIDS
jgi:hypothetical protein